MEITDEIIRERFLKIKEILPTTLEEFQEAFNSMDEATEGDSSAMREWLEAHHRDILYSSYADGVGNSESVWLINDTNDLRALWLYYDHESPLNFYAESNPDEAFKLQKELYADLPEEFSELLVNNDLETYELLNIVNSSGEKIYYGTVPLLFSNGQWSLPESYVKKAIEFNNDGGLRYIFEVDED